MGVKLKEIKEMIECARPSQDCQGHLGPDVVRGPGRLWREDLAPSIYQGNLKVPDDG